MGFDVTLLVTVQLILNLKWLTGGLGAFHRCWIISKKLQKHLWVLMWFSWSQLKNWKWMIDRWVWTGRFGSTKNSTGAKHTTALPDTGAAPRRLLQRQRLFVFERPKLGYCSPVTESAIDRRTRARSSGSRQPRRGQTARAHDRARLITFVYNSPSRAHEMAENIATWSPGSTPQQETATGTYASFC